MGRSLRFEEDWPKDVTPDLLSSWTKFYEFQLSGLSDNDVSMVLRPLEDKWLGASPPQGISSATASG